MGCGIYTIIRMKTSHTNWRVEDEDNSSNFGCFFIIGVVILGFLVYYGTIYVHTVIFATYKYSWIVYLSFAIVIALTFLTKASSFFVACLLFLSNAAFLSLIYTYIIEAFKNTDYMTFVSNANGLMFMKYALIFVPYIAIATPLFNKDNR
ncbi:hypothetical protein [Peribacillus tepidiphilus]|jgi:hypothetical protein|uniref:hypothetical protein n=1 Tax=Peribacillus tepidiphilus TaxID=2652445 RepID=UPI0035B56A30